MKQLIGKLFLFISIAFFVVACTKETSYESGNNIGGQSVGTLKDSLGNCQSIVVNGSYKADSALTTDNYVLVQVNVTTPGQYNIYSDTSNGFWFRDSGYTTAGLQTIKLKGYGKPILTLNTDFIITYNSSFCTFTVNLTSAPAATVIGDYFPTTIGSNWAYDITGFADTLHIEAAPTDKLFGSNLYRIFIGKQASSPDDSSYFRKLNGDYFTYNTLDPFGNTSLEYIMLKDNQPVGTQWDSPSSATTFTGATEFKLNYTIIARNTSVTVNNVLFDSVIRVQQNYQYKIAGTFQTLSSADVYFAKNIGLIKIDQPGVVTQTIRRWKVY